MGILNLFTSIKKTNFPSIVNGKIEVIEINSKKKIIVGGAEQTGGTITGMWDKTISKIKNKRSKIKTCLVLGLGGGDVIRSILKRYPKVDITCIEIDPVMINVAKKYFDIKNTKKLNIIQRDAFEWIKKNNNRQFNLIVVDLYIGKLNPQRTDNVVLLKQLKKLLAKNGTIIYNRHYFSTKDMEYRSFVNRCREVFENVTEIVKYKYCRILQLDVRR